MGNKEKPNNTSEIIENNLLNSIDYQQNITILDLSNRELSNIEENVKLPSNLIILNLSNNKLKEVPTTVLNLEHLKTLDLSFNNIVLFNQIPNSCHTLENLNLCNNKLKEPPYWIWTEGLDNLATLNLSNNQYLCMPLDNLYIKELVQCTTLVKKIYLHNCNLKNYKMLLSTFKYAEVICLGDTDFNYMSMNHLESVPCDGLQDCIDVEVLDICNTNIYTIQHNIDIYKNLKEINLSMNNINSLPNEFCNLKCLEVCVLSYNKILYLPDDVHKLSNLKKIYLDNNELCMLPETITQLCNLKAVDLYNNHLYEGIDKIKDLDEYDFAQNYNDEPKSYDYLEKKRKIRLMFKGRSDGRAPEVIDEEYEKSEEEFFEDDSTQSEAEQVINSRCSSPEDWDSDDYWIPSYADSANQPRTQNKHGSLTAPNMQWLNFVQKKMSEGNFCPIDMHLSISISEKVAYDKMHNPQPVYESDGQFDDYSEDDT